MSMSVGTHRGEAKQLTPQGLSSSLSSKGSRWRESNILGWADLWSQLVLVPEVGWPSKSPRNLLGIWNIEHHLRFTELESEVGSSKGVFVTDSSGAWERPALHGSVPV